VAQRVGLFVPCYVDQFFPDVGLATLELLEGQGLEVEYPEAQTCCGQPLNNSGSAAEVRPLAERFVKIFRDFDYVVCPSGSCSAMVRHHYQGFDLGADYDSLKPRVYELCEFLTDVLGTPKFLHAFPHKVGLHESCHGLRELRLGRSSELVGAPFSKVRGLLSSLEGIQFATLERSDECCGFGGTFSVAEEAVSCSMGRDRLRDHEQAGTEVLASADMSCLMHLSGLMRRGNKQLPVMHVAQILAGRAVPELD
jgi:L-lactate dehydrogenase complex protein LldE